MVRRFVFDGFRRTRCKDQAIPNINRCDPMHWPGIDPEQYLNTKETGGPRRAREGGPTFLRWVDESWPRVRPQRGLRQAAGPSVGILNWFSNRKSKLRSSDTDSQMGSSIRYRDPPFGSPKWDPAGGIPDRNPPMGTPSPEHRRSLAGENVMINACSCRQTTSGPTRA